MPDSDVSILYVCTYWGVRSQIAQLLTQALDIPGYRCEASGLESGKIGPLPRQVMQARGLSLSAVSPKSVFERVRDGEHYDYIVTLCNSKTQEQAEVLLDVVEQLYQGRSQVVHWEIPDFMSINAEGEERVLAAEAIVERIESKVWEFLDRIANDEGDGRRTG